MAERSIPRAISLPMTVDQFKAYLHTLTAGGNGHTPPVVLWRGRGAGYQVFQDMQKERMKWGARQVEIIVREVKR